jgi:hypothetical protein
MRAAVRLILMTLVYLILLFGAAGTVAWPQAWAYVAVLCAILGTYLVIVGRVHRT